MFSFFLSLHFWFVLFFFFKQKTAYEMRISDWSSDVCSSDLQGALSIKGHMMSRSTSQVAAHCLAVTNHGLALQRNAPMAIPISPKQISAVCQPSPVATRSEEHTSEIQSLMRNSYAVFCLKKQHTTK